MGVQRLIDDVGCMYKLAPAESLRHAVAEEQAACLKAGILLSTAGGRVDCRTAAEVKCSKLDEGLFDARVLKDTPSVISVGQRCHDS